MIRKLIRLTSWLLVVMACLSMLLSVALLSSAEPDAPGETTPQPSETQPPAPTDTQPPAPTETDPPAPTETDPPAPTETDPPAPTETDPPAPTETDPPAPTETDPPEPSGAEPTEPTKPTEPEPPAPTQPRPTVPPEEDPDSHTEPVKPESRDKALIRGDAPTPSVPSDEQIEFKDANGRYYYKIPETWTAGDVINWFILHYELDRENFAIAFYCPETGERYGWNEDTYMIGASTYKLPLNMYYYEKQNAGEWSADMKVGGMTLAQAHYYSIVLSMNPISQAMFKRLGSYDTYRSLMLEHYGGMDKREVPAEYFSQNYFSPRFMINTLSYLYEHLDEFKELHDYMLQAMQDRYLQKYRGSVEVAHKYGTLQGHENDVGIVFTEQPFLVAIYTQYVYTPIRGEELIGRIGAALIAYQTQRTELDKPEPTEETPETEAPGTEETAPPDTEPPVETSRETAPAETVARSAASSRADSGTPWYFIVFPLLILAGAVAGIVVFKKR
ncbi:MAG: serine hydrolase [Oscillospiraceae bacterium]|nr:serine hydrolase [Oscillospiraceae bacterium]